MLNLFQHLSIKQILKQVQDDMQGRARVGSSIYPHPQNDEQPHVIPNLFRNLIVGLKAQPTIIEEFIERVCHPELWGKCFFVYVILNLIQDLKYQKIPNHLTATPTDTSSQGSLRIACSFCKVQHDVQGRARVGSNIYPQPNKVAKEAFTLAEVLITLGIIGVVAAMTIPTLMSKYREKVLITKLKESYSMISQAYKLAIEENGDASGWSLGTGMYDENAHKNFANKVKPFLKLSYDCVGDRSAVIKNCSPKATGYSDISSYAVVRLMNGATLVFRIWSPTCSFNYKVDGSIYKNNVCGQITVLLEPDKKQQAGLNSFSFYATTDSIVPFGLMNSYLEFEKACNPNNKNPYPSFSNGQNMYGCTAWVLQNNNMDYWECFEQLGWDKARNCHK